MTTITAVADELKVSRQWVHQLWQEGRIHGMKIGKTIILDREHAIRVIRNI